MLDGRLRSPAARLGAYGMILALAFGGGALAGATLGPDRATDDPDHEVHSTTLPSEPVGSHGG